MPFEYKVMRYWVGHCFTRCKDKQRAVGNVDCLQTLSIKTSALKEFPGGPVVRTQLFHWGGPDSVPHHRNEILQAGSTEGKLKKKEEEEEEWKKQIKKTHALGLGTIYFSENEEEIYLPFPSAFCYPLVKVHPSRELTFPSFWVLSPCKSKLLWAVLWPIVAFHPGF